jgi:hypothetical protein
MINFPDAPAAGDIFVHANTVWMWDTVKWAATSTFLTGVNVLTPAPGSTVILPDHRPVFINTGALSALTIHLPPSPTTDTKIEISFAAPITTLTVSDDSGANILPDPTSAYGPGAALEFRFTGTSWVYWK